MTPDEMFLKVSEILGKTELEVKQTPYISLIHDLVEVVASGKTT